jgi:sugar lactone lactonase YvrE
MSNPAKYFARIGTRYLWVSVCLSLAVALHAQEVVQTLAGAVSIPGHTNGPAKDARFNDPTGLVMDSVGNLYIADSQNHVIRRITAAGGVTTLAGVPGQPGTNNGAGSLARFDTPSGIALDSVGNLFVCDTANHTIRKVTPDGLVTTLAGMPGEADGTNGVGSEARFNGPLGIAVATNGTIFVADSGNHAIRKITSAGIVTTLAGELEIWGSTDGAGESAHFNGPVGLALDGQGNVIVADANNHTLRKVTPEGVVTTLAGLAGADGCEDG